MVLVLKEHKHHECSVKQWRTIVHNYAAKLISDLLRNSEDDKFVQKKLERFYTQ
jgi:hypothetical protein